MSEDKSIVFVLVKNAPLIWAGRSQCHLVSYHVVLIYNANTQYCIKLPLAGTGDCLLLWFMGTSS